MARTEASLSMAFITQDFLPEHWDWTDVEKQSLGDIKAMSDIICKRIESAHPDTKVTDCYAIKHDKDYKQVWDETTLSLTKVYKTNHIHALLTFSGNKLTLTQISTALGLGLSYIEPPKSGRYSKDNKLAYLIHAKEKDKHHYSPMEVYTHRGEPYMGIYMTRKDAWEKSKAKKNSKEASENIDWLLEQILTGKLTKSQIMLTDEYYTTYAAYSLKCDAAFSTYGQRKAYQAIRAMEQGEFNLSVFYVTGKPGSGKSYFTDLFVNEIISRVRDKFGVLWQKCSVASTNPLDDWNGEEILVMDDLRGMAMNASDWLKLLDPERAGRAGTRYKNKFVVPRVIVINAERDIIDFFYYLKNIGGGDRTEAMDQFIRRIMNRVCVVHDITANKRSVNIDDIHEVAQPVPHYIEVDGPSADTSRKLVKTLYLHHEITPNASHTDMTFDDAINYLIAETMRQNRKF